MTVIHGNVNNYGKVKNSFNGKRRTEREKNKKLTLSQRLKLAVELSDLCRDLSEAGKKARQNVSVKKS